MLFYLFFVLAIIFALITILCLFGAVVVPVIEKGAGSLEFFLPVSAVALFITMTASLFWSTPWFDHAGDLGTVKAQQKVIMVYEARVHRLTAILSIEQRRLGPWSGVIWFVGDYK